MFPVHVFNQLGCLGNTRYGNLRFYSKHSSSITSFKQTSTSNSNLPFVDQQLQAKTLVGSRYAWWSGNARFIYLTARFIGAHAAQAGLIVQWAGAITIFELAHYLPDQPLYDQGLILLPHLANLGIGITAGGEILRLHFYLDIGCFHIASGPVFALGGSYHAILGDETLDFISQFSLNFKDRTKTTSILGIHLSFVGSGSMLLSILGQLYAFYDAFTSGGGDIRISPKATTNLFRLASYLLKAPFGGQGWIISINNLEDLLGGHQMVGSMSGYGGIWHTLSVPPSFFIRAFLYSGEATLGYSLSAIGLMGFIAAIYSWYNVSSYPSEFYGPSGMEASQAQAFTFLVRDQKLGAKIASTLGPTGLAKYLMRSPTGEIIFGGETMRFWSCNTSWVQPFRDAKGLNVRKLTNDVQTWQERRAAEYMTHAPIGSLNSVGGIPTEVNAINFVSPRSWLTCSHWLLAFSIYVGHWWHASRSRASAVSIEIGLSQ